MLADRAWQARVRLASCLLLETVDAWCRDGGEFPTEFTVASLMFLLSRRCQPDGINKTGLREHISGNVTTPAVEYEQEWPQRESSLADELIQSMSDILSAAVAQWDAGTLSEPSMENVTQRIVDEVVARQYVVFHHYESTRRDVGGFHGSG